MYRSPYEMVLCDLSCTVHTAHIKNQILHYVVSVNCNRGACSTLCVSEIHQEVLHRPVSGYVPEEIWKKAGVQLK